MFSKISIELSERNAKCENANLFFKIFPHSLVKMVSKESS